MKTSLFTSTMVVAVACATLAMAVPAPAVPSVASTPQPAAAPPKPKGDVCSATRSKWAHLQCEQFNASAPGDEYFGRMKISYLGIDNTYRDGAISAGAYTTDPKLISKLDFATEALRRWAAKYPNDPQLPRSYFLAVQVLRKVYTQPEQELSWQFIQLLVTKYGSSYFGKVMSASLKSVGYTEHWFALAHVCPTPLPPGVMPDNMPNATPSPSPAPGKPAVDVITPPCVASSPVPTEEPDQTAPAPPYTTSTAPPPYALPTAGPPYPASTAPALPSATSTAPPKH